MVQLALAIASVLVLPTLSSFGAYAAPLPAAVPDSQQIEVHVPESYMTADLPAKFTRPMAFYRARELASTENSGWSSRGYRSRRGSYLTQYDVSSEGNEEAVQSQPPFVRRQSTSGPIAAHRRPARPRFASGKGRKRQTMYGGMYTSGASHSANAGVNTRETASQPAAGVPGKVSVVMSSNSSEANVDLTVNVNPIASLVFSLDSNSTAGLIKATASANNHTTLYLTPASSNGTALADPSTLLVNLKLAVFDPERAALVQYCATYDPAPSSASSITAEPCQAVTAAHSSQIFVYSPTSNVVHPLWTQDANVAPSATGSNTSSLYTNTSSLYTNTSSLYTNTSSLYANTSNMPEPSVRISNATSTLLTCHPDSHYVTNALLSDSSDANMTATPPSNGQSLFELVFIPDATEFLEAPTAPAANVTEALTQHVDVVDTHSEPAPPTFTDDAPLPTSTMPSAVNAVHLAEALLPMIPLPDSADGTSTPAPTPTGR